MGMFDNMFGKIGPGMCRLSMNGNIAVKTSNGYKTYNVKTGKLTNCSNFVFNFDGMEMFFMIPTNRVHKGDIIIANGKPKCVIEINEDKSIKCINYETAVVENILPERHVFMGNTYFYGKIVSMFGDNLKSGKSSNNIMKYMMLSSMMKGNSGMSGDMSSMLPMMMLMGNGGDMFNDMFGSLTDTFTESIIDEDIEEEDDDIEEEGEI